MSPEFDALPKRQILSYRVRGPELEAIFGLIRKSGPLSFETLSNQFAATESPDEHRKDDLLLEALDFLRAVELVGRWRDEDSRHIYQVVEAIPDQLPFRLLLMRQLHRATDGRRAFRLVHDIAVRKNLFFTSREDLLKQLEVLYPEDYAWNIEKLRSWEWLAAYLGLVRPLGSKQVTMMICPQPELVVSLLRAFAYELVKDQHTSEQVSVLIGVWLRFLDDRYLSCITERRQVYDGLGRTLLTMDAAGQITVGMKSDAPGSVVLGGRQASHIDLDLTE